MNQSVLYTIESHFGPPSELISLSEFLEKCSNSTFDVEQIPFGEGLSEERVRQIEQECSVDSFRTSLIDTVNNPFLHSHLTQGQEDNIESILATALPGGKLKRVGKRKRTEAGNSSSSIASPAEVTDLQKQLDAVALKSWSYPLGAAAFIRAPRNSDSNVLVRPRPTAAVGDFSLGDTSNSDLVLTVSTYSRLSWGNHLARSFQHAVLSSQTLGDLYEALPCPSNEIPFEKSGDGTIFEYSEDEAPPHKGGVVCIEDVAYGDGQSEEDYSDKLLAHFSEMPPNKKSELRKGPDMHSQRFLDLSLRINEPYWLLHQGSCEHFIVVDQIRLKHPSDPMDGYPFTLHIAPPILDLCQACARVPATLAINGDIRFGQSPCKMCGPCWKEMGEPQDGKDRVVVVPLRKYQIGW